MQKLKIQPKSLQVVVSIPIITNTAGLCTRNDGASVITEDLLVGNGFGRLNRRVHDDSERVAQGQSNHTFCCKKVRSLFIL